MRGVGCGAEGAAIAAGDVVVLSARGEDGGGQEAVVVEMGVEIGVRPRPEGQ